MATRAWIGEQIDEDGDEEGRVWLSGVFYAHVDSPAGDIEASAAGLPGWDAALAWAKVRADVVFVDVESDGRYTAHGSHPTDRCPALPAAMEVHLRQGRRRPLVDQWLDRTDGDPPMAWEVAVSLEPDIITVACIPAGEQLAAQVARSIESGAGVEDVTWSSHGLAEFAGRVPPGGDDGELTTWTTSAEGVGIQLVGRATAPAFRPVAERVAELTKDVLDRANHRMPHAYREGDDTAAWDGRVLVQPPGYLPPFGTVYDGIGTVEVSPDWR